MTTNEKLALSEAVTVTIELCGATWSEAAVKAVNLRLQEYPVHLALSALRRCQDEIQGRLTLAAIIERIEGASSDGWPTPNEAWAAVGTLSEARTLVCVEEAFTAQREVMDLMKGDEVGARMAFMDGYKRLVGAAKADGRLPTWRPSLGQDKAGRKAPLLAAVEAGRLPAPYVANLLGEPVEVPLLGAAESAPRLPGKAPEPRTVEVLRMEQNAEKARELRELLDKLAEAKTLGRAPSPLELGTADMQAATMSDWEKRNLAP